MPVRKATVGSVTSCILIVLLGLTLPARPPSETDRHRLQLLLRQPLYQRVDCAVCLYDLASGLPRLEHNADRLQIPASTVKLLLSGALLLSFGPDAHAATTVWVDKRDGPVVGNLYLKGGGDPDLSSVQLEQAVDRLYRDGLRRVDGDIVADCSFHADDEAARTDSARHLYAPACALSVDGNSLQLRLVRGEAAVSLRPASASSYLRLEADIRYQESDRPGLPAMTCIQEPWGDRFRVRGRVSDWDLRYNTLRLAVSRPWLYAATRVREALQRRGVEFRGRLRRGLVPADARCRLTIPGRPLSESLTRMNRDSDNVAAAILVRNLGARLSGAPGSLEAGMNALRRILSEDAGLTAGSFTLVDASGLSAQNRLSARQLVRALSVFYHRLGETYPQTLVLHPAPARSPETAPPPRIMAKSGTLPLSGVNSLAGFVFNQRDGRVYAFAILCRRRGKGPPVYSGVLTNPLLQVIGEAAAL